MFYRTIRNGQDQGSFRAACDLYILVKMIFGVIDHSLLSSIMFRKSQSILFLTNILTTLVLNAVSE
ncbi:MAG: TetR/AcrR family transcriptional regulator C-terminal domain-containing protein [bacterium]